MGSAFPERQVMQLVNTTPLQASVGVAHRDDGARLVRVTAKATFHFAPGGGPTWIDGSDVEPIRTADEVRAEGTFPRDDQLPDDGRFEVFFYGDAFAPRDAQTTELEVALSVDDERRTLRVFGDRAWSHGAHDATSSAPAVFTRMPIAPSTAFGGARDVEVDEGAIVPFCDDRNPAGKGMVFDAAARALSEHLGAGPGYPMLLGERPLANVEHPSERVTAATVCPRPAYWSAHPLDYAPAENTRASHPYRPVVDLGRAHPEWQLAQRSTLPRLLQLDHLSPDESHVGIVLPEGAVHAEILSGGAMKSVALQPRRLFVMPNTRRVAILFASTLVIERPRSGHRAVRMRWTEGGAT